MLPSEVAARLDAWGVSRETHAALQEYVELLLRWNARINLIGRSTVAEVWRRHVLDSAQLIPHLPPHARVLVDFGSGAGLPGLVLALLGLPEAHLVESDHRKSAFLREAARVTGAAGVTIHARRIEEIDAFPADVVTARALAPLPQLLAYAEPFTGPGTTALFLKGKTAAEELTEARKHWSMAARLLPSETDPAAAIVRIENLTRDPIASIH